MKEKTKREKMEEAEKLKEKKRRAKVLKNTVKIMMRKPTPYKTMLDFVKKYQPINKSNTLDVRHHIVRR